MSRKISIVLATVAALAVAGCANSPQDNSLQKQEPTSQKPIEAAHSTAKV